MSTRQNIKPYSVITNGDMTQTLTSLVTIPEKVTSISYTYSWSGNVPVGAVSVQASNDYALNADGTVLNAGTWTTLQFNLSGSVVSSAPISGNTGAGAIGLSPFEFYAVRTIYTPTSGSGTIQAVICGKVF